MSIHVSSIAGSIREVAITMERLAFKEYEIIGLKTLEELLHLYNEKGLERAITYFIPHRKEIAIALQDKALSKFREWYKKFNHLVDTWVQVSPQLQQLIKTVIPEQHSWPQTPIPIKAMKSESEDIKFKAMPGSKGKKIFVPKLHGGRPEKVIDDETQYDRKREKEKLREMMPVARTLHDMHFLVTKIEEGISC
jgi:hypothetical protein